MKLESPLILLLLAAVVILGCERPQTPKIEIISIRAGNELDREFKKPPAPGHSFVTLHARHKAISEGSCDVDWAGIRLVDVNGRQYRPLRASESRASSSETRAFGLGQQRTVHPHETRAVYEVPEGARLTRAIIGESFALPQSDL